MSDRTMGAGQRLCAIAAELDRWAPSVDGDAVDELRRAVLAANRVFLAGAGKSGLAVRAFANRLMHLGLSVHVVGDITTPSIRKGDLLVVNSASGETSSIVRMVQVAKAEGAKVATLTMSPEASIGLAADVVILVPGRGGHSPDGGVIESVQPPGSMFEDLCLLTYDAIVAELKAELDQSIEQMRYRHANLE